MAEDKAQRGKILDRVRALLSMTIENGCSEHEAMTAAAKAAKLMEEYDLTFSDVNAIKGDRVGKQSKPFSASNKSHEMHAAGIYVSVSIGNFFDCKVWRNGSDVVFFGLKDDVDLAHDMLAMIRAAMDRELSTFLVSPEAAGSGEHRRTLSHSFMRGMGHRISQRLERLKAERTANVKAKEPKH